MILVNIKIALIDTGVSKQNSNIVHFYYSKKDDSLINGSRTPKDFHGDLCLHEILKQDLPLDILSIDVMDEQGELSLSGIVLAIDKAIEERSDIINISLGVNLYEKRFYDICQKACDHNILIVSAASHADKISYPAEFKNILSVKVDAKQKQLVEKVTDTAVSVRTQPETQPSTSMAAAYFSGIFAKDLAGTPVFDKFNVLYHNYEIKLDRVHEFFAKTDKESFVKDYHSGLYENLKGKKKAVILLPECADSNKNNVDFFACETTLELLSEDIVAFYDYAKGNFYSLKDSQIVSREFETILIINTHWYEMNTSRELEQRFSDYEIYYIGEFKKKEKSNVKNFSLLKHYDLRTNELFELKKPIILILGFGYNFNKFEVQVNLTRNFKRRGAEVKAITYNSKGIIYGFDVFEYPQKVTFPDIVCSINNHIFYGEFSETLDMWIINIGGSCFFVNNQNKNNFGKLSESYFHAANVDVVVVCIDCFASLESLHTFLLNLDKYGVKHVCFVVSKDVFDPFSADVPNSLRTYRLDKSIYQRQLRKAKNSFKSSLFTLEDVANNKLYENIINFFENG